MRNEEITYCFLRTLFLIKMIEYPINQELCHDFFFKLEKYKIINKKPLIILLYLVWPLEKITSSATDYNVLRNNVLFIYFIFFVSILVDSLLNTK